MRHPLLAATAAVAIPALSALSVITAAGPEARPRSRDIGLAPGVFPPGALDAITDVAGVRVGHVTLVEGDRIRTGVTAILPHPGNVFRDKVAGAVFVGNAFGKLAGSTQVTELGTIETPRVVTTAKRAAIRLAMWKPASPMPITGAFAAARAASRPVSSKQAMMWASAPSRSASRMQPSMPGTAKASS